MSKKLSKRYKALIEKVKRDTSYSIKDAVELAIELKSAKFDESVDVALRLGVDPRHADQMIRGAVILPHGTGKKVRVAAFVKDERFDEAKEAGADIVGNTTLFDDIKAGKMDFDILVTSPDMMGQIGQLGRILGPKGLMPNPKVGTISPDIATAISNLKGGQISFRVDKKGNIHVSIGKASFDSTKLQENLETFIKEINKQKPASSKGKYIKSSSISLSMSPSVKVDSQELADIK
jgi:large subunit ribosomal protein L1